jgi:hypothetical protein
VRKYDVITQNGDFANFKEIAAPVEKKEINGRGDSLR